MLARPPIRSTEALRDASTASAAREMSPPRFSTVGCAILRIACFLLVFGLAAVGLHQIINFGLRGIHTSAPGVLNKVMAGKVNAQIIISGSSRALVHYDPRIIQRVTGKTAYNIGRNGSHIDMQLALLRAYLRHNTKPELIIHNLDLHSFQATRELYEPAQYVPYLDDPDIYSAVRRISPDAWKWRYLPLYGYAVEDMRFHWVNGLRAALGWSPREDHFLGFNPRNMSWTGDFEQFQAQHAGGYKISIEEDGVQLLRQLVQLCADHGVRLIFVYAPEYYEAQLLQANRSEVFAAFSEAAAGGKIQFWDFSSSSISRQRTWFYNSQHLNATGAELFSKELAKRLQTELPIKP